MLKHFALITFASLKSFLKGLSDFWWQRGKFVNSLKYQIEKQLRESIYLNETYKGISWTRYENRFLHFSKYPFTTILTNLIVWGIFIFVLSIGKKHLSFLSFLNNHSVEYTEGWLKVVLACQVTILGLVFPLVIALIGINLQSRSANRALWELYKNYSSLFYNGLNGLLLVFFIVLFIFLKPIFSPDITLCIIIGLLVWFLYNLELLAWFLFATIEFVSIAKRSQMLLRYSINEVFIDDIRLRLSKRLPQHAVHLKLINGQDDIDAFEKGNVPKEPLIQTFGFNRNRGKFLVEKKFKQIKYLDNIFFRILNFSLSLWKNELNEDSDNSQTKISLPINNYAEGNKNWVITATTNQNLSFLTKHLFIASYRFRRKPLIDTSLFNQILNALVGNIEDALKENNERLFNIALDEMIVWHNKISESLAFINDDGKWDNWILLGDGSFFSRSYIDELQREYWQLIRSSLAKLSVSREYFNSFCYFYLRVYGFKNDQLAIAVQTNLISSHASIWSNLMWWYSDYRYDDRSLIEKHYKGVIRTFVSSWEGWSDRICPSEDGEYTQDMLISFAHHLQRTAKITFEAFLDSEEYAAQTSVDLLLHWYENFFWRDNSHHYLKHESLLTHILVEKSNDALFQTITSQGYPIEKRDLIAASLKNVWIDIRIITACYIISESLKEQDTSLNPYADAIINGNPFHGTGSLRPLAVCINSGRDIFISYLKHRWFCIGGDESYSGWIEKFTDLLHHSKPTLPRISGRVYSDNFGIRSIRDLNNTYILLAIIYSKNKWSLSDDFVNDLLLNYVKYEAHKRLLWELENWTKPDVSIIKHAKSILGEDALNTYLLNYLESIDAVSELLLELVTKAVSEAELDIDKIIDISKQASEVGFDIAGEYVPTSFFREIRYIDDLSSAREYSIPIGNYSKETIAQNILEDSKSHIDSNFSRYIGESVRDNLFRHMLKGMVFDEKQCDSVESMIATIVYDSQALADQGLSPVCFVGSEEVHEVLNENISIYSRNLNPLPYKIQKTQNVKLHDYKCHIESLPLFRLPFSDTDYCLVIPKESFNCLELRENIDDKFVYTGFIPSKDDKTKGILHLSYWMNATFEQYASYKYVL